MARTLVQVSGTGLGTAADPVLTLDAVIDAGWFGVGSMERTLRDVSEDAIGYRLHWKRQGFRFHVFLASEGNANLEAVLDRLMM